VEHGLTLSRYWSNNNGACAQHLEYSGMWYRLTPADLRRGRHQLNLRRAETLKRHAEEIKAVRARQADELRKFDEKHAEIDALEHLLDIFAREFQNEGTVSGEQQGQAEVCHAPGNATNAAGNVRLYKPRH
jgi:hypothetical protein